MLDIVKIPKDGDWVVLRNQYPCEKHTETTLLTSQDLNTEKRTNLKGDHCAPPSRQVFQSNKSTNELVDKAVIEQAEQGNYPPDSREQEEENSESLEAPKIQHPLTQEGNKRRTQEERIRWQEANDPEGKKSQTDRTIAKCKRLGKPLQKGVQPTSQSSPPTAIPSADTFNNPDPAPDHKSNIWNIDTKTQNIDHGTEQKIIPGNLNKEVFTR